MGEVPENFTWPEPWKPLPLPETWIGRVESLDDELRLEVCAGHPLFGVTCRTVGWNSANLHEFLFATDSTDLPLVFVHLTWRPESDPRWPRTIMYAGWEAFRVAWQTQEAEPVAAPDPAA